MDHLRNQVHLVVLCDQPFFGGHHDNIARVRATAPVPALCKDFIVTEYQVIEARAAGADAVLLMASVAAACTLPKGERGLLTIVLRPETCTLLLWLLLLLYPSLAKTALTPFDCVAVDDWWHAIIGRSVSGGDWPSAVSMAM